MTSFVFRIDEIRESNEAETVTLVDPHGNWQPSVDSNANIRIAGGVSGKYYLCDGQRILQLEGLPQSALHYKTYSMYYASGTGFWVLEGDATSLRGHETWQPLRFEWDLTNYSSYLTNAGEHPTLRIQRDDQPWPRMLLPDIYHSDQARTPYTQYGYLKGDLPIFLALLAFSVRLEWLSALLPNLLQDGQWQTHEYDNGRTNQRGVVVYVYTCPHWPGVANESTRDDLSALENGNLGYYYY